EAQGSWHLGQKLLFAIYRSALGIEPPTSLTDRVLEHFGAQSVEEVLHRFHNRQRPAPGGVDRLTPLLLDEAQAGDTVALSSARGHGGALGGFGLAAARQVGLAGTAFHLVLAGGVFQHPTTVLEDAIVARVRQLSPEVRAIRSPYEPIVGVLCQALTAAGAPPDRSALSRLVSTIPAAVPLPTRPM